MSFRLTVLGISSAVPTMTKHQTAHVLNIREQFYLLDAGEGVQSSLKRADINLLKINCIFISHLHGDHFFGIYGLLSTMSMMGRERKLQIFGPSPIKEVLSNHCKIFEKGLPYQIEIIEVNTKESEKIFENNVITVETISLKHGVPTVGYLFKEKEPQRNIKKELIDFYNFTIAECQLLKLGTDIVKNGKVLPSKDVTYKPYEPKSFAYCLDTTYSEKIISKIYGADLLLIDSTFLEKDKLLAKKRGHCTSRLAAQLGKDANVKKILLTHFSTRYKVDKYIENPFLVEAKEVFENVNIAKELEIYDV